jgi:hypothetical protein
MERTKQKIETMSEQIQLEQVSYLKILALGITHLKKIFD